MHPDTLKRAAARAALDELVEGAVVGVGSGSTVDCFVDALAAHDARARGVVCASERSAQRALAAGLAVLDLNDVLAAGEPPPVYVDGADEIDARRRMIKGGGAALTREKILAAACTRFVCIVDRSKCVERLGAFPLPVEVVPMAREFVARRLRALGGAVAVRAGVRTDNGNEILDVRNLDLADPARMEAVIESWPGVVTAGLFAARPADVVLVATPDGVERRDATGARE